MAFNTPYTFTALELLTAAKMNAIQTNISTLWPYIAAGDMPYASSATGLARRGIGASGSVWKSNGSLPNWFAQSSLTDIPGQLHAVARVAFHNEQTRQSTTFADVTGGTVDITTTNICDIVMVAWATIAVATAGQGCWIRGNIGGTEDTTTITGGLPWVSWTSYTTVTYEWYRLAVAAGTITVKMQWASTTDGSTSGYLYGGGISVRAYNTV